jgi:hypothetical protein
VSRQSLLSWVCLPVGSMPWNGSPSNVPVADHWTAAWRSSSMISSIDIWKLGPP